MAQRSKICKHLEFNFTKCYFSVLRTNVEVPPALDSARRRGYVWDRHPEIAGTAPGRPGIPVTDRRAESTA